MASKSVIRSIVFTRYGQQKIYNWMLTPVSYAIKAKQPQPRSILEGRKREDPGNDVDIVLARV